MAPLELDGDSLGKKHQHYNRLLKEAIKQQNTNITANFKDNEDIENLLNIDAACINKNVEFILEVLKCDDMLYVSRAIKRSSWLIREPSYAHIINIDYLNTHQFPYMTAKAINKLMLSIRLNIRDEKRAEEFFVHEEKRNIELALKWLPYCSLSFIEQAVVKYRDSVTKDLLERLCKRSISVLEVYLKNDDYVYPGTLTGTLFLININAEKYLDIIEKLDYYRIPTFGPKYTEIIMKKCPQKIFDNFEKFSLRIDYATCAKYMKTEDIKPFLLKVAGNEKMNDFLKYDNIKHILLRMPQEGRFEFIKQMFINTEKLDTQSQERDDYVYRSDVKLSSFCGGGNPKNVYDWYRFAAFDVAMRDLKKLIRAESSPEERNSMLNVLLYCAGSNMKNVHILLQYYYEKHINEPFKYKSNFVDKALQNINIIKHSEIWLIINRLFHSMEVYVASGNNVQKCIEIIIIYNAIHNELNPKLIDDKFSFNTLKGYKKCLNPDEREKVFKYLYNHLQDKINNKTVTSEKCLSEVVEIVKICLNLLNDWDKKLNDYPTVIIKIKELLALKREKFWDSNFSSLYHVNKKWRKYIFEESIVLSPTEPVCINALKHDPSLLARNEAEIHKMCCDESISLRTLLNKLRLYWPLSVAAEWAKFYLQQLNNPSKHKAVIKGLMIILPSNQLTELIKQYAPKDTKINWGDTSEHNLSLRKSIAKTMYLSRPLLPTELVLMYAKGDYLQYAVPSLCSILSNLSNNQSPPIIKKLLTAPVSLQKYGIRLAFSQLEPKELKPIFSEAWKSTSNSTIRAVLFEKTYKALCLKTNCGMADELWSLLSDFIDNLTHKENKKIYTLLGQIQKVPFKIRGKFYMKSYNFLKSMPSDEYIENILNKLIRIVDLSDIMDQLDTEFIATVMLKGINISFDKSICKLSDVISTNLLFCNSEKMQNERYERILGPLLEWCLPLWDTKHNNKYYIRYNIGRLVKSFTSKLKYVFLDPNRVSPYKIFTEILNKFENSLSIKENYVLITTWKLLTAFTELLNTYRPSSPYVKEDTSDDLEVNKHKNIKAKWEELFTSSVPSFAKICTDYLKLDVAKYFPTIYLLYGEALYDIIGDLDVYYQQYILFKHMLDVDKSNENYLLVINYCAIYALDEEKPIMDEIQRLLEAHESDEIRMHWMDKFKVLNVTDF